MARHEPESGDDATHRTPVPTWDIIFAALAVGAFAYALTAYPARGTLLLNAGIAMAIGFIFVAQESARGWRAATASCVFFGLWTAAVFQALVPQPLQAAAFHMVGGFGPGSLVGVIIGLVIYGAVLGLLMWPYARRVVGLERQPLWADEAPALRLTAVTILALFIVYGIAALIGQIMQ